LQNIISVIGLFCERVLGVTKALLSIDRAVFVMYLAPSWVNKDLQVVNRAFWYLLGMLKRLKNKF